jgi:ribosomal-protein-alanine N-acetyltransferase
MRGSKLTAFNRRYPEVAMPSVSLRAPTAGDVEAFIDLTRKSAAFHEPWVSPPTKRSAFDAYLEGLDGARKLGFLICRPKEEELLGLVNVSEIVRGAFHSAYLGYWIGAPFARQGYMRAGLHGVIRHCFDKLNLHRLEANVQPENEASIALVRSLGFRREGYSPQYLYIAGAWRDHERWAILNPSWRPAS